jgi:hypothetical protein
MYTSQFAESANQWVSEMRLAGGIVELLAAYLKIMTSCFSKRKDEAQKLIRDAENDRPLSAYAQQQLDGAVREAAHMQVQRTNSEGKATVKNLQTGVAVTVELGERYCSDQRWTRFELPCAHMVAVHLSQPVNSSPSPNVLVGKVWTADTLLQTYSGAHINVSLTCDLNTDDLLPPKAEDRKKAGRPRKRQRIPSRGEKTPTACGNCGNQGHNARTCTLPKLNKYTEQKREQAKQKGKQKTSNNEGQEKSKDHNTDHDEEKEKNSEGTGSKSHPIQPDKLLEDVSDACLACKKTVAYNDAYSDCKKCCRWIHLECVPHGANVDRFVCVQCTVAVPTGTEVNPCPICSLETIDKCVGCDECDKFTHLVCANMDDRVNLDHISFICRLCVQNSKTGPKTPVVPCVNAGNSCYLNCTISSVESLPLTVIHEMAEDSDLFNEAAAAIVEGKRTVSRQIVSKILNNPAYMAQFESGREHEVGEAFQYLIQKTKGVEALKKEIVFTFKDTRTCSNCGQASVHSRLSSFGYTVELYMPSMGLDDGTVSLQELIWLNKSQDIRRIACHNRANGCRGTVHKQTNVRTIEKLPNYLVMSLRREVFDRSTNQSRKNMLGLHDIFARPVVLEEGSTMRYRPCAVSYHRGERVSTGHWWAHVQHPTSGRWWNVDDGASKQLDAQVPTMPGGKTTVAFMILRGTSEHVGSGASRLPYQPSTERQQQLLDRWATDDE